MAESGGNNESGSIDARGAGDDAEVRQMKDIEDKLVLEVQAKVSEELSSHIARLELEMKDAFNQRMTAMASQCTTQAATETSTRKVSI